MEIIIIPIFIVFVILLAINARPLMGTPPYFPPANNCTINLTNGGGLTIADMKDAPKVELTEAMIAEAIDLAKQGNINILITHRGKYDSFNPIIHTRDDPDDAYTRIEEAYKQLLTEKMKEITLEELELTLMYQRIGV